MMQPEVQRIEALLDDLERLGDPFHGVGGYGW